MAAKRILVVEDEASERTTIVGVLKSVGFRVTGVQSGEEAIRKSGKTYDLILCDYHMGKVDGRDVLVAFRGSQPKTPFVMLTGERDTTTAVGLMREGAKDYLPKPVSAEDLIGKVRSILEQ